MLIILNIDEINRLLNPAVGKGGFQSLLRQLQQRLNAQTGELKLSVSDLERIPQYAFDYKNGGWENQLLYVFQRTLGPQLGREISFNRYLMQ